MRLCFRAFDAVKLMTSGASPIAQYDPRFAKLVWLLLVLPTRKTAASKTMAP
jgi:hypothetical protein